MPHERRPSTLQKLAAKWRVIGLVVTAFARLIRRYEDGCRQGTYEPAAQLELAARAAHAMLMKEVAEALDEGAPETVEDQYALDHLRNIAFAMLAIAFVMQNILMRGLRPAACWLGLWCPKVHGQSGHFFVMPVGAQAILDPG